MTIAGKAGQGTLRVLSWNIDSRANGLPERIAALGAFGADVVLLQEVPRSAARLLGSSSDFVWAEVAVLHSEPGRGAGARIGPAILGTERVQLMQAGQVPAERFVEAGRRAGLSDDEVAGIGWRHKTVYVDVEIDGLPLRLASFHARPGTGGGRGKPYVGWVKQLFHRVCAQWVSEQDGAVIFGVDANSPKVDHPDPEQWQPFMSGEATLIGPRPSHHLTDALYRWFDSHPEEMERVRAARPNGPLAVSYFTTGARHARRYDHLFVTEDIDVASIEYREPYADGSDHGALVADLRPS